MTWRGRSFVMENSAAAELVLSKDGGIQRNLIPIGEGVTRFDAKTPKLCFVPVMFDVGFHGHIDAVRQPGFDLQCEVMIRPSKMHNRIFVDQTCVDRAWRKDISVCGRRESRLREADRRPIGSWKFFTCDDNGFGGAGLRVA